MVSIENKKKVNIHALPAHFIGSCVRALIWYKVGTGEDMCVRPMSHIWNQFLERRWGGGVLTSQTRETGSQLRAIKLTKFNFKSKKKGRNGGRQRSWRWEKVVMLRKHKRFFIKLAPTDLNWKALLYWNLCHTHCLSLWYWGLLERLESITVDLNVPLAQEWNLEEGQGKEDLTGCYITPFRCSRDSLWELPAAISLPRQQVTQDPHYRSPSADTQ